MERDPDLHVRHALVRYPSTDGRRWYRFDTPIGHLTAWDLDEVAEVVAAARVAAERGNWVVGFVGYDAAPAFDDALAARRDEAVPLVAFGVFDRAIRSRGPAGGPYQHDEWVREVARDRYVADLGRIRAAIAAGETYQVNHTFRLHAAFDGDPLGLFSDLARAQRADHMAYIDLGGAAVCSVSPELFIRRVGDRVWSRPMKGTRPRHPDPVVDRAGAEALLRSAKDRAENTMIVDMVRNDLGRIARPGTVEVHDLYAIEQYPTVHQMTSTVAARTDADLSGLLSAMFPAASITGAPKVRTSRLIADLETSPRGVYTGAVGAIEPGGDLELNVAIRTVWIDRAARRATYGVGGGIVWDSEPDAEWREAADKTRVLARARGGFRLLETMRYEPAGGVVLLDRHCDRLRASAEHFGFDLDLEAVRRLLATVHEPDPATVRLTVGADGATDIEVLALAAGGDAAPWELALDTVPIRSDDEMLYHKTTRRDRYDAARARFPGHRDVVLWNERGEVTETTIGNLVVRVGGDDVTPPVRCGLLPGTFRAELLDAGAVTEAVVTVDDLAAATRAWMVNSVRGWVPVRLADRGPEAQPTGEASAAESGAR